MYETEQSCESLAGQTGLLVAQNPRLTGPTDLLIGHRFRGARDLNPNLIMPCKSASLFVAVGPVFPCSEFL